MSKLVNLIRVLVVVILGGIGAAAGFTHTHDWALHHGQPGWLAWADAIVIEGLAVVAGFELHYDHHTSRRGITLPLVVLVVAFGVQMTAQVAEAERTPAGWLVAGMPALGFLIVVKLLMRRIPAPTSTETEGSITPCTTDATSAASSPPSAMVTAATTATPMATSTVPDAGLPTPTTASATTTDRPVVPRLRLPEPMRHTIATTASQAALEGRTLTTADIRAVAKVSEDMATQILADLARHNGHPVSHP